jgi:hypothetical protein
MVKMRLEKGKIIEWSSVAKYTTWINATMLHTNTNIFRRLSVRFDKEGKLIKDRPKRRKNTYKAGTASRLKLIYHCGCSGTYQSIKGSWE